MATRKTKQDISKEDMFNKIMPSLNQKNNDDDIEEEAPKKSTRTKSTADKKTARSKTSASKSRAPKETELKEDSKVTASRAKKSSRAAAKPKSADVAEESENKDESVEEKPKKRVRNSAKSSEVSEEKTKKTRTTRKKEDEYAVININEELMNKRFDEIFQKFNCCHCNGCRFTVMAVALNELPAKYIAVKTVERDKIIEESDDSHIRSAIIQSILKLMISPLH